jgi:hypothetical protein
MTMKYVVSMGGIWRLTNREYERLFKDLVDGKGINLDDYGKMFAGVYRTLSELEELAEEEAEETK